MPNTENDFITRTIPLLVEKIKVETEQTRVKLQSIQDCPSEVDRFAMLALLASETGYGHITLFKLILPADELGDHLSTYLDITTALCALAPDLYVEYISLTVSRMQQLGIAYM
ncbi:MAG TPA: hypothetical protein VLH19_00025 [Patescibacteria group bacterium]|nr:hypothetical protein [Patescibacteria group bacterium]